MGNESLARISNFEFMKSRAFPQTTGLRCSINGDWMMEIRKVGILGAGTMGRGIAAAIVQKGVEVLLCEKDQELAHTALEKIAEDFDHEISRWAITEADKRSMMKKLSVTADTAELVGTFSGHKQNITSIAFSPDHKTLASSSEDSTLKFWNIATQQELLTIRRLGGPVRNLMFSPDGQVLAGRSNSLESPSGGLCFYRAPGTGVQKP